MPTDAAEALPVPPSDDVEPVVFSAVLQADSRTSSNPNIRIHLYLRMNEEELPKTNSPFALKQDSDESGCLGPGKLVRNLRVVTHQLNSPLPATSLTPKGL